ncbi:hypothetical protein G7K_0656-t1 [Saitoella complicata NRRL Y-17804]|uniref:Uncharacterized protein n=1 Tax=Saitoella complicata (strain BCRC 22490 / CBS 7301 / JCM 7358 / NBRC 10748 / NRRL Y-17804) TaxID=698492 RepID=A0A0E9NAK2_SAICN|nr:hypothetical protein G7K_0656-t1 [Saitoella complicata NRRL Y-17804]
MATDKKQKPSALRSILAGGIAGGIEIAITYPAEFAKTSYQLRDSGDGKPRLPPFGKQWYTGCSTVIIGNSIKAAVRFLAFDTFKHLLSKEDGSISAPATVLAGLGAGVSESIFAVTPFESIKTALIDDRKGPNPRLNGFVHGTSTIIREGGFKALYKGLVPTIARQGANSAVRMSSYNFMKQAATNSLSPGEKLGTLSTFGIGATAGVITVYTTMPLDVIKSRMQSLAAKTEYRNSAHCAYRIFTEEGVLRFWSGAMPRLARLVLSGGIVFTVYEKIIDVFEKIDPDNRF